MVFMSVGLSVWATAGGDDEGKINDCPPCPRPRPDPHPLRELLQIVPSQSRGWTVGRVTRRMDEGEEEEARLWLEAGLPKPLSPADFLLPPICYYLSATPPSPQPRPLHPPTGLPPVSLCLVMVSVLNY